MSLSQIRSLFGVAAFSGGRVRVGERYGTIVGTSRSRKTGYQLLVRFDDDKDAETPVHPAHNVVYRDTPKEEK